MPLRSTLAYYRRRPGDETWESPTVMPSTAAPRGLDRWVLVAGIFAAGYLAAWTAFSAVATLAHWALDASAAISPTMTIPAIGTDAEKSEDAGFGHSSTVSSNNRTKAALKRTGADRIGSVVLP